MGRGTNNRKSVPSASLSFPMPFSLICMLWWPADPSESHFHGFISPDSSSTVPNFQSLGLGHCDQSSTRVRVLRVHQRRSPTIHQTPLTAETRGGLRHPTSHCHYICVGTGPRSLIIHPVICVAGSYLSLRIDPAIMITSGCITISCSPGCD